MTIKQEKEKILKEFEGLFSDKSDHTPSWDCWDSHSIEISDIVKKLDQALDQLESAVREEIATELEFFWKNRPPYGNLSMEGFIDRLKDSLTHSPVETQGTSQGLSEGLSTPEPPVQECKTCGYIHTIDDNGQIKTTHCSKPEGDLK